MREPGIEDATRRTRLANERTYLAWWRTGLTSIALGVGVGRIVPQHHWAEETLGAAFGLLGITMLVLGYVRRFGTEEVL